MAQIDKPNLHFNTLLYTGNAGTVANSQTGLGFQPDWLWGKKIEVQLIHIILWADAVRGKSGTGYYAIASDLMMNAETGSYPPDGVTTIVSDSDGL